MMLPDDLVVMDVLQKALDSRLGIEVSCSDMQAFRRHFYQLKKEFPQYACIELKLSATRPQERIWLIKKEDCDGPTES